MSESTKNETIAGVYIPPETCSTCKHLYESIFSEKCNRCVHLNEPRRSGDPKYKNNWVQKSE